MCWEYDKTSTFDTLISRAPFPFKIFFPVIPLVDAGGGETRDVQPRLNFFHFHAVFGKI